MRMLFDIEDYFPVKLVSISVRELFRAGLSPNTILRYNIFSKVDTADNDSLKRMLMEGESLEATPLLEATLLEYRRVHSSEKSSGNDQVQDNANRGHKASDNDVSYDKSASRDTAQRFDNNGDSYSTHSVSRGRKKDQGIKADTVLVAGTPEPSVWLEQENNNSNYDNDYIAYSKKENVTLSDSDPVEDSRDDLVDTSFQFEEIHRRHSSKLIRDVGESKQQNHEKNCRLTIWHAWVRMMFVNSENQLRKYEPFLPAWLLTEIWLEFGADPRIVFFRKSSIEAEEIHNPDRRSLITMDTVNGVNIAVADLGEDLIRSGSIRSQGSKRILVPLLEKVFEAHGDVFSLEDYVHFAKPPSWEKLIELMKRNRLACDEADRVRAEKALKEKSMWEYLINTSIRKVPQIVIFGGFLKSWLLLSEFNRPFQV